MITPGYKEQFNEILDFYKKYHIDPWHTINEEDVMNLYNELVSKMDVDSPETFYYFINYIFQRICGKLDAHTYYEKVIVVPLSFRIIDDYVFIDNPKKYKGYYVKQINGIDISNIISELDDIIIYGTPGKRQVEIEKKLMNKFALLSIPSLRNFNELNFEIENREGVKKTISDKELSDSEEAYKIYLEYNFKASENFKYSINDDTLILNIFSFQNNYSELLQNMIKNLNNLDLSNINKIILDVRGNHGGNGYLCSPIYDFLNKFKNIEIICLIDKHVFSAARSFITTVKNKYNSINIGEEISTPLNVFGNNWPRLTFEDGSAFCVSDHYIHPSLGYYIDKVGNDLGTEDNHIYDYDITYDKLRRERPEVFEFEIVKPDIEVVQTVEDYLNDYDNALEVALNYIKGKSK